MSTTIKQLEELVGKKKIKGFTRNVAVDGTDTFKVQTKEGSVVINTLYPEYHVLLNTKTGLYLTKDMAIEFAAALIDAAREI